jgi:F0F1-type ATP synthase membrane subunit b/b'
MPTNAQKTLTDVGYIAVGLGVMGFQQAQTRARAARDRVGEVGGCVAGRARDVRSSLDTHSQTARQQAQTARTQAQTARTQAETQLRNTVAKAGAQASALRGEVEKRVEPVVGQVQSQLGDIPERVVQAMEPVTARVRELAGNAA